MEGGGLYKSFVPFSIRELKIYLGFFLLNVISPSPRLDMKFSCQEDDPENGNDL